MRDLQAGWWEDAVPWEHTGLQFSQTESGEREDSHSWVDVMLPLSAPPPGWAAGFVGPYTVKQGPQSTVFHVCRKHVLEIINLLSFLGRMWVSCHCFIVLEHVPSFCCMVLCLSKLVRVIINLQGSPVFCVLFFFFFSYNLLVGLTNHLHCPSTLSLSTPTSSKGSAWISFLLFKWEYSYLNCSLYCTLS